MYFKVGDEVVTTCENLCVEAGLQGRILSIINGATVEIEYTKYPRARLLAAVRYLRPIHPRNLKELLHVMRDIDEQYIDSSAWTGL